MSTRFGKYRGFVVDNDDPKQLGRIRARVPEIFGSIEVTDWAWPVLPFGGTSEVGFFFIPDVGAGIYIEFEAGSINRPLWTGVWWAEKDGVSEVPTEIRDAYPNARIIKTSSGFYILIDDKNGTFKIFHPTGTEVAIAANGDLNIQVDGDCNIHCNNNITIDADGIVSINP